MPIPGVHFTPLKESTLGNVLSDAIRLGEVGEAVDGLNLIADWVEGHYAGPISAELDAFAALNRLVKRIGYDDPDIVAIRDWIDPLPRDDVADGIAPQAVFDLLTRVNAALVGMDRAIKDASHAYITREALDNRLNDARPNGLLFAEIGAMRDAARLAAQSRKS